MMNEHPSSSLRDLAWQDPSAPTGDIPVPGHLIRIGVTAGDPAGIGLEIVLKTLPAYLSDAQWILFGPKADFEAARRQYQPALRFESDRGSRRGDSCATGLWFCPTSRNGGRVTPGRGSPESGRRALDALQRAADLAVSGDLDGIVTAPLSKRLIGPAFTGQTEFLRDAADKPHVAMSFFTPSFNVVLATTHLRLRDALDLLSVPLYERLLVLIDSEMQSLGYPQPRIGVAGVNPHAGEEGMFGREDDDILAPAVRKGRDRGLRVSGPWPADTCYLRAHRGEFDVVLAPYHDQGLIPVKLIAPGASTNVTLGLPFVRTSPDHGTAFDIAGQSVARTDGMKSALEWGLELVRRKKLGAAIPAQSVDL